MGCGVSSTYVNDASLNNAAKMQPITLSPEKVLCTPENSPKTLTERFVLQETVDRQNALQMFNNIESAIQTMEETKCFEKYRIISDDIEQLKEQLQHFNDLANQMNNKMYVGL